jgi:hypothetical protein
VEGEREENDEPEGRRRGKEGDLENSAIASGCRHTI